MHIPAQLIGPLTGTHVHVALQPALRPLVPRPGVSSHVARRLEGNDVDVTHLRHDIIGVHRGWVGLG